jgi:hypothetical protein
METKTESDMVIIEGPVDSDTLRTYTFDDNLTAFRRPDEQFQALVEIAELPEGRIIVSHINKHIVGYIIFLHPDPLERWSDGNHPFIMELGAVEVACPAEDSVLPARCWNCPLTMILSKIILSLRQNITGTGT